MIGGVTSAKATPSHSFAFRSLLRKSRSAQVEVSLVCLHFFLTNDNIIICSIDSA